MSNRQPQFERLDPTTTEVRQWLDAGLCAWCGSDCPGDQCYARKCDSCTSIWKADTLADVSDGYRLTEQQCPECDRCLFWTCDNPAPTFAPADWFETTAPQVIERELEVAA